MAKRFILYTLGFIIALMIVSPAAGHSPTQDHMEKSLVLAANARDISSQKTKNSLEKFVTVKGLLVDKQGNPIEGAIIEVLNRPFLSTVSEPDGRFVLTDMPGEDVFLLKISKEGYLARYISSLEHTPDPPGVPTYILYPLVDETMAKKAPRQPVVITAEHISYERDMGTYQAEGSVVITYDAGTLTADSVALSSSTHQAFAKGHVTIRSDRDILQGNKMSFNIDTRTGVMEQGRMFLAKNHFYITGDRFEKRGEATYFVENATATTCDGDVPDWKFTGGELEVTIDGYGTLKHGKFHTKDVPVLYMPYLFFPVKTTRQSGFLMPYLSYSQDKLGWDTELPFFWAMSGSADATFHQRYMSQRGYQQGVEFRYFPSRDSFGTFYADYMNDSKSVYENTGTISRDWWDGQKRWALYLNHETTFQRGFYFRADIAKVSDIWYFKDFTSRNYFLDNYAQRQDERFRRVSFMADESLGSLDSTARLVRDSGLFNATALVRYTDDFTKQSNDGTLQKYPEVTFTAMKQPLLGMPVNYELSSAYDYYYRQEGQKGHLYDIQPTFSLPFNMGRYAQITPYVGWKGTFWSRDDNVPLVNDTRQGERQVFSTGATLTTELERIFNVGGEDLDKIRHSIKPEITYAFVPNVHQGGLPDFASPLPEQNKLTYALTNSLTARMKDKDGKTSYHDIMRLKLSQAYDIIEARRNVGPTDKDSRPFGDVDLELDFNPHTYLTFAARNKIGVNSGQWTQTNYDLTVRDGRGDTATVGYRYTLNLLEEINLSLKAVINRYMDLTYVLRRNKQDHKDVEKTYGLNYRQQCWNIQVSYSDNMSYIANGEEKPDRIFMVKVALHGL